MSINIIIIHKLYLVKLGNYSFTILSMTIYNNKVYYFFQFLYSLIINRDLLNHSYKP